MKLRYKIYLFMSVLAAVFLWGRCSRKSITAGPNPAAVLPKDDTEQIIVDPVHHRLTVVTPSGPKVVTLPDKPSVIDIHKDGGVQVTSPQSGFEHRFFFGIQGSNAIRAAVGMDIFYVKKLDIGFGMMSEIKPTSPLIFVSATYNVYSNLRAGLTYDNKGHFGGILTVRI